MPSLCHLSRFAAAERRDEELVLLSTGGDEPEVSPIGRPAGGMVFVARREAPRGRAAVQRRQVDTHPRLVRVLVRPGDHVRDLLAIRRYLRVYDGTQGVEVSGAAPALCGPRHRILFLR